jgi:murein L,D-transpeptidase YcbB/YkuD
MAIHAIPVVPAERQPAISWLRRASLAIRAVANSIVCMPAASRVASWRVPDADPASVQRILVELGQLDARAATGVANPAATCAVIAFQHANGLPADGVADARTVHVLASRWHSTAVS